MTDDQSAEQQLDQLFGGEEESENSENFSNAKNEPNTLKPSKAGESLFGGADSGEEELATTQPSPLLEQTLSNVHVKNLTLKKLIAPRDVKKTPMLLKLPGFMGIEKSPYSASRVLEEELGAFENVGDEHSSILLGAATSIRWRPNPKAKAAAIQSNGRLVKWSDGSWSLMVGEELFELSIQSMTAEHNFIFGRHTEEGSMECLGKLKERVIIRPYITDDQNHRKYLAAAAVASAKANADVRVKMAVTTADPEREKQRMIKIEQEKIKARRKLEAKRRNLKQRSLDKASKTGLTAKFLEERDNDDEEKEDDEEEEEDGMEDEYEDDFIDDTQIEEEDDDDSENSDKETESESEAEFSSQSTAADDDDDDDDGNKEDGMDKRTIIPKKDNRRVPIENPPPPIKRARRAAILDDDDDDNNN